MQETYNHYRLYLPLADNEGHPAPRLHAEISLKLARLFGGFTAWDADGVWVGGTEYAPKTYSERVRVYDAHASVSDARVRMFLSLALDVGEALNQEAVMLIVGGNVRTIDVRKEREKENRP
jgi:hypothetical protein